MLPGGHVAYTWAALNLLQRAGLFRRADYRGVALAALLPDLIDKPLAIFVLPRSNAALLFAHTLLAQVAGWALAWSRGGRRALPYALAFAGHLLGDRIWGFPQTFLWPARGRRFHQWRHVGSPRAFGRAYLDIIRSEPKIVLLEAIGLALLAWFVVDRKLWRPAALRRLIVEGRVD
jgi:hypothetical protein